MPRWNTHNARESRHNPRQNDHNGRKNRHNPRQYDHNVGIRLGRAELPDVMAAMATTTSSFALGDCRFLTLWL